MVGVVATEVTLRRKLGGKSLLAAAVLSALPDADIVSRYAGPWEMLKWHRAESHSLLVAVIAMPLLGLLCSKLLGKGKNPWLWIILSGMCLGLHILNDLCTSWGTEIYAPLSNVRYALDSLPIIDVFFSVPLIIATLTALAMRKYQRFRFTVAASVVCWCLFYTGLGFYMNHRAKEIAVIPAEFRAKSVRATPGIGSILLWRVIAKNDSGDFFTQTVSTWTGQKYFPQLHTATKHPLIELATKSMQFKLMERASSQMLFSSFDTEQQNVKVVDMRYSMAVSGNPEPVFSTVFEFSRNNELISVTRMRNGPPFKSAAEFFKGYLALIFKSPAELALSNQP